MMTNKQRAAIEKRRNGFLCNCPLDVIAVVNGHPVRKSDVVNWHREEQKRIFANIRQDGRDQIKPCIVWTFYNDSFVYGGWWLYVVTHKERFEISLRRPSSRRDDLFIKIMNLFPCGVLPMLEYARLWMKSFADTFPVSTAKRPKNQGMKIAWAKVSASGRLLDIGLRKEELL